MVLGVNSRLPNLSDLLKYADKALLNNELLGDWNLYDSKTNKEIVSFDTFLGYDYSNETSVMSHPIENGSFANYNKVSDPYSINVILAKSGFPFEIRDTISTLEKYKDGIDCIDIVTPYKTYSKCNLKSMHYAIRESSSVNLLVVELSFIEIKEVELGYKTVGYSSSNVSNGDYADSKDTGKKKAVEESATNSKNQSLAFKGAKKIAEWWSE